MPIIRTPIYDDDGTGTSGTAIDNAWKQELYNQIDGFVGTGGGQTVIANGQTGALGTWAPVGMTANCLVVWYGNGVNDLTVDGIVAQAAGSMIKIRNASAAGSIFFRYLIGTGATRLWNLVTSGPTPICTGGSATYISDGTTWILVQHEQGALIRAPFSAADFTSDVGSWTVTAGGIGFIGYRLSGRQISFAWYFSSTTTAGSPNYLRIHRNQWGGYTTPALHRRGRMAVGYDGAFSSAIADTVTAPYLAFNKLVGGAWGTSVVLFGDMEIQVD